MKGLNWAFYLCAASLLLASLVATQLPETKGKNWNESSAFGPSGKAKSLCPLRVKRRPVKEVVRLEHEAGPHHEGDTMPVTVHYFTIFITRVVMD